MEATITAVAAGAPTAPRFQGATTTRRRRVLGALLQRAVWREELDRIAGSSNGPDEISHLRKAGLPKDTCLVCEMRASVDRDGKTVSCGLYSLTEEGRRRVLEWMDREGLTIEDLQHPAS
jgi:hypothetical protein